MKTKFIPRIGTALLSLATLILPTALASAQGTAFTYQGRLDSGGVPYTGSAEFQATLWDTASGGAKVADNAPASVIVGVTNGLFVLPLDFGANLPGADRWLQLEVRTTIGSFITLSPRQPLTPTPYAITASNLTGPLPAAQLSGTVASANLEGTYSGAVTLNNPANSFSGSGAGLTGLNASSLTSGTVPAARLGNAWRIGGNDNISPGTHFVGTSDNQAMDFRVDNRRAFRLEPAGSNSVNVVGGWAGNYVAPGVVGATVGGGGAGMYFGEARTNRVMANFGTVSGGGSNTVSGFSATVAGGENNTASDTFATVSGGLDNTASGGHATVGGGLGNSASGTDATVGGGSGNRASSSNATVGGGIGNSATINATVGGGVFNHASGGTATVGGGDSNTASGESATVGGGFLNTASGMHATIPGGLQNAATNYAFAAGRRAKANHQGAFVWADSQTADHASQRANQFRVRADGGVRLDYNDNHWIDFRRTTLLSLERALTTSTGAYLNAGGSWVNSSDRDRKENFEPADPASVLDGVVRLPISTWNYKSGQAQARHLGPMAQDFHAAFGLGGDDKAIATVDATGVALAAIQGLNHKVESGRQKAEIQVEELKAENADLKQRLAALEQLVSQLTPKGE